MHEIEHEKGEEGGRYVIRLADDAEAELTYRHRGPDILVADHTFVPPTHRGKGIAAELVGAIIRDARDRELRIDPVCPYVATQFRRHPEWSDLRAG